MQTAMKHEEFRQIRLLTGCNQEQFSKCFGLDYDDIRDYENCARDIPQSVAEYMGKIRETYERAGVRIATDDSDDTDDELRATLEYVEHILFVLSEFRDCIVSAQIIRYGPKKELTKHQNETLTQANHYVKTIKKQKAKLNGITKAIEQVLYHG